MSVIWKSKFGKCIQRGPASCGDDCASACMADRVRAGKRIGLQHVVSPAVVKPPRGIFRDNVIDRVWSSKVSRFSPRVTEQLVATPIDCAHDSLERIRQFWRF